MGHTIHHYYFRIAPRPAGPVRIARLGPGGPSSRAALRLALRPRDGWRRALCPLLRYRVLGYRAVTTRSTCDDVAPAFRRTYSNGSARCRQPATRTPQVRAETRAGRARSRPVVRVRRGRRVATERTSETVCHTPHRRRRANS